MPLDEESRRLTQLVLEKSPIRIQQITLWNQQLFLAFMSKILRPLIFKKTAITYLDDTFMQSQTKDEMFIILEQYHQILKNEIMKAAPDKSHFFSNTCKVSWTYY